MDISGNIEAIYLRPLRRPEVQSVGYTRAIAGVGLEVDPYAQHRAAGLS